MNKRTVTLSSGAPFTVTSHTEKLTGFTYSTIKDVKRDWALWLRQRKNA